MCEEERWGEKDGVGEGVGDDQLKFEEVGLTLQKLKDSCQR